jgi:xylulokinase
LTMKNLLQILGIDLGTSSVKMIYNDGESVHKVKASYISALPDGWWEAVCIAAKSLDLTGVRAIGLSSQVGTYIIDGKEVVLWSDPAGKDEVETVISSVTREEYIREIDMPHPRLASYPLPRLLYIKKHFPQAEKVCQPKELLCEKLTGRYVADKFSYRGLAGLKSGRYSQVLLECFGIEASLLPPLAEPFSVIGHVTEHASAVTGIPMGTPVVLGCNDFFAGLAGMGVLESGDAFDITGTSEHLGVLCSVIPQDDDGLVCGAYFNEKAHYGVTASSGCSIDFALSLADLSQIKPKQMLNFHPPLFLPYLNGERAPIWDPDARGVFFGIEKNCTKEALAYAVAEGVCFSLYHIYETMEKPQIKSLTVSGGAGKSSLLNTLKASVFSCPVKVCDEPDASALGAQLLAAVGIGDYGDIASAANANCAVKEVVLPDCDISAEMHRRFEVYRELYPKLKDQFGKL